MKDEPFGIHEVAGYTFSTKNPDITKVSNNKSL